MDSIIQTVVREYGKFISSTDIVIDTMCQSFDKKKNAFAEKKRSHKKSGVLDSRRLSSYKFTDDLFKKRTVVPNQKSHSVHVLLDWSASIQSDIVSMTKQAINLARFCRKSGIFFRICAFSTYGLVGRGNIEGAGIEGKFSLIEFLSSELSTIEFKESCKLFYIAAAAASQKRYYNGTVPIITGYNLGGTPLNSSLISYKQIIDSDIEKHRIQNPNLIVITDGVSDTLRGLSVDHTKTWFDNYSVFIDPKNNKRYYAEDYRKIYKETDKLGSWGVAATNMMMNWYRDYGINTIQIYISDKSPDNMASSFFECTLTGQEYKNISNDIEKTKSKFMKRTCENLGILENFVGYNKSFFIKTKGGFEDDYSEIFETPSKKGKSNIVLNENKSISEQFSKIMNGVSDQKIIGEILVNDICKFL